MSFLLINKNEVDWYNIDIVIFYSYRSKQRGLITIVLLNLKNLYGKKYITVDYT